MDKSLILLLRDAEWQLNDLAFAETRGLCTRNCRTTLAQTLNDLVPLLRQDTPMVVDSPSRADDHA